MVKCCLHLFPGILTQNHVDTPIQNHWVVTEEFLMVWIFCCLFNVSFSLKRVKKCHKDILLRGRTIWFSIESKCVSYKIDNGPRSVIAIMKLDSCDCVVGSEDASCVGWCFLEKSMDPRLLLINLCLSYSELLLETRREVLSKGMLINISSPKRGPLKLFSKKISMENMEILNKYPRCFAINIRRSGLQQMSLER